MPTVASADYTRDTLLQLFVGMHFPQRSAREDALIAEFLQRHIHEYDRYAFDLHVGTGRAPNPDHLPGVQRQTVSNSQMRIDMMAWQGAQPFIFEVKERAIHAALGQCLAYSHLWQQDNPDARAPRLAVIARTVEPDMLAIFKANGITLYLYPPAAGDGGATTGGVPPVDGAAP